MADCKRCRFLVQVVVLFVTSFPVSLAQSSTAVIQAVPQGNVTVTQAVQASSIAVTQAVPQNSVAFTEVVTQGSVTTSPLPQSNMTVHASVNPNATAVTPSKNVTSNSTASRIHAAAATSVSFASASIGYKVKKPVDRLTEEMNQELNSTLQKMDATSTKTMKPDEDSPHDAEFVERIVELTQKGLAVLIQQNHSSLDYTHHTDALVFGAKDFDCIAVRSSSFPDRSNPAIVEAIDDITDTITTPLECPIVKRNITEDVDYKSVSRRRREVQNDFEDEENYERHDYESLYRFMRHRRSNAEKSSGNRFIAQITLKNTTFNASMMNKLSPEYGDLRDKLQKTLDAALVPFKIQTVKDLFVFRAGSVIVDFYVDTSKDTNVSKVRSALSNATAGDQLGNFTVSFSPFSVNLTTIVDGNYTSWQSWGPCDSTFKQQRNRTCTNPAPKHGGKPCEGPSSEKKSCECGSGSRELTGGGNITSPLYPNVYPADVRCVWKLKAPINNTVTLELESFKLEEDKKCLYDYMQVYDGNSTDAAMLSGNLCGVQSKKSFKSTSREMLVVFNSDESVTEVGFKASWTAKLQKPLQTQTVPQSVTVLSVLYTPRIQGAFVPLGRATTCPLDSKQKDCIFDKPVYIISRLSASVLSRNLNFTKEKKISFTLSHIMHKDLFPKIYDGEKSCVIWDPTARSNSEGGWTRRGCSVTKTNLTHTSCKCDRTGVFAVVGEEKVVKETFSLLANTYTGMGVSFVILVLAIVHIVWKIEIHGGEVMRMNMCISIIVMQCVFLIGAHVKAEQTLCGFLSFLVYFCVLAEFCWLLLHALRIHGKIKKIFATNLNLELVYVVIGWGLPLLLSVIAIGVQIDLKNPDDVCWKAAAGGAMWGYGAPVVIIALANTAVLVKLLIPTEELKAEYDYLEMRYRVLKDALFLMSFGTTCTMAYQVVDKASFKEQYYLALVVVLQAVAMFIFGREGRKDFVKREPPKKEENESGGANEEEQPEKAAEEENKKEEKADSTKRAGKKKRKTRTHEPETIQVPNLKNLNIYKKDGQYVIEA